MWFHGRTTNKIEFDPQFCGLGADREGPGFYLSSDYEDAASYAFPKGIVIVVNLKLRKETPKKAKASDINFLMDNAKPESLATALSNWDENPRKARVELLSAILDDSTPYTQAWYELYRNEPWLYLKNMVKLGYDGFFVKKRQGVVHAIVYNPKAIEVVEVIEEKTDMVTSTVSGLDAAINTYKENFEKGNTYHGLTKMTPSWEREVRETFSDVNRIYRAIRADKVDKSNLGIYWTFDFNSVSAYWGDPNKPIKILVAEPSDSDIDWLGTIEQYMKPQYAESEVRLKKTAKPKLIKVYDDFESFWASNRIVSALLKLL